MAGSDSLSSDDTFGKFLTIWRFLRQQSRQISAQGMNPRQIAVLRFLAENGPATVGEVQDYMYLSASMASTLIAQLEEAGYASRTRSDADNRVVIVALTTNGQQIVAHAPVTGLALLRRRLRTLPAERQQRINQALTDIIQLMEITESE